MKFAIVGKEESAFVALAQATSSGVYVHEPRCNPMISRIDSILKNLPRSVEDKHFPQEKPKFVSKSKDKRFIRKKRKRKAARKSRRQNRK